MEISLAGLAVQDCQFVSQDEDLDVLKYVGVAT
jgi:hypothetical protein